MSTEENKAICRLILNRMNETGIGYGGIQGISWSPALEPFILPRTLGEQLHSLGEAVFLLYDAVDALYQTDELIQRFVSYKFPDYLPPLVSSGQLSLFRLDIVLTRTDEGTYQPVVTEVEVVPGMAGLAHCMQEGYGLQADLLDRFIEYLAGRPYIVFVASHSSVEFSFEQAVFCQALRERGVNAQMVFDKPIVDVHQKAQAEWMLRQDAPAWAKEAWSTNFQDRLNQCGFNQFVSGLDLSSAGSEESLHKSLLAKAMGGAVVYRLGYFPDYTLPVLQQMFQLRQVKAKVINPIRFYLENKAVLGALAFESVRQWIQKREATALAVLDHGIAETCLLESSIYTMKNLKENQKSWVLKNGAWDLDNLSWGSRSLEDGRRYSRADWYRLLGVKLDLPYPVIAQRRLPSAQFDIAYVNREKGDIDLMSGAIARLCIFFLRMEERVMFGGAHITLRAQRGNIIAVHGALDAVWAPVVFQG